MEGFNAQVNRLVNEREEYFEFFANAIFKDGKRPAGTDWVIEEFRKLPPWLSAAIYSDYIATDFTNVLPTITVPTLVVNADGPVFAWGIKQGTYLTSLIPNGKFVVLQKAVICSFMKKQKNSIKQSVILSKTVCPRCLTKKTKGSRKFGSL